MSTEELYRNALAATNREKAREKSEHEARQDLQPGDAVIIWKYTSHPHPGLRRYTVVTRVTGASIFAGGERFVRETGSIYGNRYSHTKLYAATDKVVEDARDADARLEVFKARRTLANNIEWSVVSPETILAIHALIEADRASANPEVKS